MTCTVYPLIGDDDKPIYIGASTEIDNRLRTHRNDTTVYDALGGRTKHQATRRIERVTCTDYDDMRNTELRLIKEHRPVLNAVGNNDVPFHAWVPAEPKPLSAAEQAKWDAHVAKIVAAAPPLTDEQRTKLAELLKPARQGGA